MSTLNLTNDELLSTTRAVRKRIDFDRPVSRQLIEECLELALQAPSGSNSQAWQFVVVTDQSKRKQIAEIYAEVFCDYEQSPISAAKIHSKDPSMSDVQSRVMDSAKYLADHLHKIPAFLIPCITGRTDNLSGESANFYHASLYASIIPATWSFMLAARSRGLGSSWTTLHLQREREVAEILGIPYDQVTQIALISIGYTVGTHFKLGARKPLENFLHIDGWKQS